MTKSEPVSLMEPMLPQEDGELNDLVVDLIAKAKTLAGGLNPSLTNSISDLVRSMNCYYSNLIEGHNTHPRDIDRALNNDFVDDTEKRDLQLEAKAHIEVQSIIDQGDFWQIANPVSVDFVKRVHHEFYQLLPENLLWVENFDRTKRVKVIAGEFRDGDVVVGRHLAPHAVNLDKFMARFEQAYSLNRMSKVQRVVAVAASHHRLLWIHPFYDGNGRVARLFSHALLKQLDIGSGLWSVSRGLARRHSDYKFLLEAADLPRQGDLDGRGSLSQRALKDFCKFFLEVCIDQVDYMSSILEPKELLRRIELYVQDEMAAGRLPKRSFALLREAFYQGEFARGEAAEITGYKVAQARVVLSQLVAKGFLKSDTSKGPVRLAFPIDAVERWFPQLYPIA